MSEHAFLAPSAAARWVRCAYAPTLEARYPEREPSADSLDGDAAHWVAAQAWRHGGTAPAVGSMAPNGLLVTDEMVEGAQLLVSHLHSCPGAHLDSVRVEETVSSPNTHPTKNWGTPDYWFKAGGLLVVLDYKFGHRYIDAFENWQLLSYAAGLIVDDRQLVVELVIVQPRSYYRDGPIRRWRVNASELRPYFARLREAASAATSDAPKATPTVEGCRNCRGRHVCSVLQAEGYLAVDLAVEAAEFDLPDRALGAELRTLHRASLLLDARIAGLKAEAEYRIKAGARVPFWSLELEPGRLSWTMPDEAMVAAQLLGLDIKRPAAPITPTQAAKAGMPKDLVALYAERKPGAPQLTYDDGSKARRLFQEAAK